MRRHLFTCGKRREVVAKYTDEAELPTFGMREFKKPFYLHIFTTSPLPRHLKPCAQCAGNG